nr:unnamed protein product [Digitaria exilis]
MDGKCVDEMERERGAVVDGYREREAEAEHDRPAEPRSRRSSWNTTTHYCLWNGVTCSSKHPGRVMKLDLGYYGLSGSLSPSLGNLTLIEELNLSCRL